MNLPGSSKRSVALRIVCIYLTLSLAYVWFFNWLLAEVIQDRVHLTEAQNYKDAVFALVSGCLLYFLINKADQRRAQAEEHIRQERDFSMAVFDSMPGLAYCYDADLKFKIWNQNVERVTGYSHEEMADKSPLDMFAPSDRVMIRSRITETFATGRGETEASLLSKDGASIPYSFTSRATEIAGRPHIIGMAVNIAARKQAESALREEINRRRIVFNSARDGMVVLNADRRAVELNASFARMIGRTVEETLQLHPWDWDDIYTSRELLFAKWPEIIAAVISFETRFRHTNGRIYDVEVTQDAVEWGNEHHVLCVCRDITERKRAENRLRQYEKVVESSNELMVVVDRDYRYCMANQAYLKYQGRSAEEVEGRRIPEVIGRHFENTVKQNIDRSFDGENTVYELLFHHPQHGERNLLCRAYPIKGPAGIQQVAVVIGDTTEKKRAEDELRQSHQQLRALTTRIETLREAERERISREIHDELGQQLTGLKMDLQWMENQLDRISDVPLRISLEEKIITASATTDDTIVSVQRIATELRPAMLDSLGLISTLRSEAKQFESRTGIIVAIELPAAPLQLSSPISTTAYRIFQEVLTNVARHAQATRVQAALSLASGKLRLEVRDNGVGISRQKLENFQSLGLLSMKERATMVNGSLAIEGAPQQGTLVCLEIPMEDASASPVRPEQDDDTNPLKL